MVSVQKRSPPPTPNMLAWKHGHIVAAVFWRAHLAGAILVEEEGDEALAGLLLPVRVDAHKPAREREELTLLQNSQEQSSGVVDPDPKLFSGSGIIWSGSGKNEHG